MILVTQLLSLGIHERIARRDAQIMVFDCNFSSPLTLYVLNRGLGYAVDTKSPTFPFSLIVDRHIPHPQHFANVLVQHCGVPSDLASEDLGQRLLRAFVPLFRSPRVLSL